MAWKSGCRAKWSTAGDGEKAKLSGASPSMTRPDSLERFLNCSLSAFTCWGTLFEVGERSKSVAFLNWVNLGCSFLCTVWFLLRNKGFHWGEGVRVPSLLPVLLYRREVARPRQQALGEKTHHSGGEEAFWNDLKHANSVALSQTSKQYFKEADIYFSPSFSAAQTCIKFHEWSTSKIALSRGGSCTQQHFSRGNFVSVLISSTKGTEPEYRCWQLILQV